MDPKGKMPGLLSRSLFIPLFLIACTTPSWFPFQKGPPHKAKTKELVDKEVIVIDKREYVKVSNPRPPRWDSQNPLRSGRRTISLRSNLLLH